MGKKRKDPFKVTGGTAILQDLLAYFGEIKQRKLFNLCHVIVYLPKLCHDISICHAKEGYHSSRVWIYL